MQRARENERKSRSVALDKIRRPSQRLPTYKEAFLACDMGIVSLRFASVEWLACTAEIICNRNGPLKQLHGEHFLLPSTHVSHRISTFFSPSSHCCSFPKAISIRFIFVPIGKQTTISVLLITASRKSIDEIFHVWIRIFFAQAHRCVNFLTTF